MRRCFPLAFAVTLGLILPAFAKTEAPRLEKGTSVTLVGLISSAPKSLLGERKMQVAIGPAATDYTLHFDGAALLGANGRQLDEDGLQGGQWVRAEGQVMNDPRRIRVSRLQVVASDRSAFQRSTFHRTGLEHGYLTSVAGTRQTFPPVPHGAGRAEPMLLVGRLSDDRGASEPTPQIKVTAAGNEWTLSVPEDAQVIDLKGEKIDIRSMGDRQWVRVHGWRTNELRMRVARVESVGKDDALRVSGIHRSDGPLGYAETLPVSSLRRAALSGTVTKVNDRDETIQVRSPRDAMAAFWLPAVEVSVRNRGAEPGDVRIGDEVTVTTFTFK